jgi:hypothetical protein
MIEPSRRHGHFDTRWNTSGITNAATENKSAAGNGRASALSKDVRRPPWQVRGLAPAEAGGGGAPIQRWEDEGGRYATADGLEVNGASGKSSPAGLDWVEFLRHYFPGRRRHDLEALTAYEAYRSENVSVRSSGTSPVLAVPWESTEGATSS